jgi:hypothetical protein
MPENRFDVKERLTQIAVEDYLRDSYDLEEVARMTAENMYKDLQEKTQAQVRGIIQGLNIPNEIRMVADRRVMEAIPSILERNVPPMVEGLVNGKVGWYKEQIQSQAADIGKLKQDLEEEASKRRKVHRAHMATVAKLKDLETRLAALEPQPVLEEVAALPKKGGIFGWGRRTKDSLPVESN